MARVVLDRGLWEPQPSIENGQPEARHCARQLLSERVTSIVFLSQTRYPRGGILPAVRRRERDAQPRQHRGMTVVPTS